MSLNYLKEKIKDNVTATEIAERYLGYPKEGNRYHCHITPTESRANLCVYKDHWHCFYCNQGGDAIELVQSIFNLSFTAAMDKISQDFRIIDDTKVKNMTPEMQKRIFEADKARVVRECEKRRAAEREGRINMQIDEKIKQLNKVISKTDSIIRSGKLTDSELDTALEENINAEQELARLQKMSDIMMCKTLEGTDLYLDPTTETTAKAERKNRLVAQILCKKVEI